MNEEISEFEARLSALESAFGKSDEIHYHATIPFNLGQDIGGSPDVIPFSNFSSQGTLFVTCDLIGDNDQTRNKHGTYELAICHKPDVDWGVDLICKLAYYTLQNPLNHGETMDIEPVVPPNSDICGFLFKQIADFELFGEKANVICCIGITKKEIKYALNYGSEKLLEQIPSDYILTETNRASFV